MKNSFVLKLLKEIHEDEGGTISLETILIVGAIALPILIFLLTVGWPMIKGYFYNNVTSLSDDATAAESAPTQ